MGKAFNAWTVTRKKWIKKNPPSHEGYWYCVVGGGHLTQYTMTLDHDISRSRNPKLRYKLDNLNPMCSWHNNDKGSRSLAEYLATNPSRRCYT